MRDSGTGSINELDGLRVLVVEDEAVVAFDLELILKDFGCTVLDLVSSNAAALEVLAQMRPDIVVLDVRLGDGSAEPVAKALSDAGIPFIVATGYDGDQIAEPLLRAAPRLPKPYRMDELRVMLAQVAGSPSGWPTRCP
jgi:CheY-like chemotaxis protein